ncbi:MULTISPECIES: outer membrane beta-barrel protein [unclassified Microbulbifer]|uniref:outer membrane protein n=1 Tax=unclassified Microbulbifer TaxID=2619833 RepID=UPI0027E532A7|nr:MULTISPECIES: outer membrane beta-barrel protein [unclassified Microbulbifer]
MKKILFVLAFLTSSTAGAIGWNNPIEGICAGEYRVITTLGSGQGDLQIENDQDFFGLASIGITPTVGVWQVELRYSHFDGSGVTVDQYGINFKVDFSLACDVQCLYWMAGWNYGEFDVDTVEQHGFVFLVDDHDEQSYWNAGVGYRYNWTDDLDTSLEYNYNDIDRVAGVDLGHLRTWTLNLSYRF